MDIVYNITEPEKKDDDIFTMALLAELLQMQQGKRPS